MKTTVRTIYALDVEKQGDLIILRITGNGFLYNMVRIIAGTLMKIGQGDWEPERIPRFWQAVTASWQVPPHRPRGLTLMEIHFKGEKG